MEALGRSRTTCWSPRRGLEASSPRRRGPRRGRGPTTIDTRCSAVNPHQQQQQPTTTATTSSSTQPLTTSDVLKIRDEFPILRQDVHGDKRLVYLDNAATSQKPQRVLTALDEYYTDYNSNVHRGVHALSAKATERYEEAREKVSLFVNASTSREIVFTRNASEAINLVAYTWGVRNLREGDEVVLTVAEHHSNIVPWQILSEQRNFELKYVYLDPATQSLDMNGMEEAITSRTKLVTVGHVSNVLGSVNPVREIVAMARSRAHPEAKVLLDACQSIPHMPVDLQALGVDFAVCSGHKMCAPTGIGFLWGKMDVLEGMPPFMGGGEMIADVFETHSTYAKPPGKFEAGTPAICEAIGLGEACDYLTEIGMDRLEHFELEMGAYMYDELVRRVEGIEIYGPSPAQQPRAALAAFNVPGLHATDISMILDQYGVAVRSGHHCTQPLHHYLGINASARASLYIYNTKEEIDAFVDKLGETIDFFRG